MKRILAFQLVLLLMISALNAQSQKQKPEPAGKWQFEAPYAPEGYTSGVMEFVKAEGKYQGFVSFTGSDYKIPLDRVTVKNDSILVSLYVEGADVPIKLKMVDQEKITGVASSPEGDIPLTATRAKQ